MGYLKSSSQEDIRYLVDSSFNVGNMLVRHLELGSWRLGDGLYDGCYVHMHDLIVGKLPRETEAADD